MRKLIYLMMLGVALTTNAQQRECCKDGNPYQCYTRDLPFQMPEVRAPHFPDRTVSLPKQPLKLSSASLIPGRRIRPGVVERSRLFWKLTVV